MLFRSPIHHGVEMLQSAGSAECASLEGKKTEKPSIDQWLREAKTAPEAEMVGMYLIHHGVVRATARSLVRQGDREAKPVIGMQFSCDREKIELAVANAKKMEGIYSIRVWLNEGELQVGDDIMQVLIGADIRPHAVQALEKLVGDIKTTCVMEKELFGD